MVDSRSNDAEGEEQPAGPRRKSLSDLASLREKTEEKKKNSNLSKISKRDRRKHEIIGLTQITPKRPNTSSDSKKGHGETDPFAYVRTTGTTELAKMKGVSDNHRDARRFDHCTQPVVRERRGEDALEAPGHNSPSS
jgi:hypothetical protein